MDIEHKSHLCLIREIVQDLKTLEIEEDSLIYKNHFVINQQNGHRCPLCLATLRGCKRAADQEAKQNGRRCPFCLATLRG